MLFVLASVVWAAIFVWNRYKILAAVLFLTGAAAFLDAASAGFYIRLMQSSFMFDVKNTFEAAAPERFALENGGVFLSDISYHSDFPNGFLDIYLSPDNETEPCPTFVFVHGGGFTWGDKVDGDPNGGEGGGQQWYFSELLEAGYNVVSINYALAPDYAYPTPMLQLCEAAKYLTEHAVEYGLDMDRVIYSGGSAGGAIVGQFLLAQGDAEYSRKTGIPQVVRPETMKAAVFASALLDGSRYYKTGEIGFDFMLNECGRVFYGEDFVDSEMISDTDIIENAAASFPPSYISDGNHGSFTDQAEDLYEKLVSLGVTAEFTSYDRSVESLGHGFEIFNTPCGADNLERTIAFLNRNVKGEAP